VGTPTTLPDSSVGLEEGMSLIIVLGLAVLIMGMLDEWQSGR
jgi:hypothetical protein